MLSTEILSDIAVFTKYARHLPDQKRRETWEEVALRNRDMHLKKYPWLHDLIVDLYDSYVLPKLTLPSMRSMQFGGEPILRSPNRIFNCAYGPVDHPAMFWEAMFLLLGGTGVGYSVQRHHINQLPALQGPTRKTRRFLVGDSIEGWADAVKVLIESYFLGKPVPRFDYSDIRPKGALLITSGGKAPGPQPLKDALHNLEKVLDQALTERGRGTALRTIEAHDMMCHIADAVLAGGIRRAALISLFSMDDQDLISAKSGAWWEDNPQRGRANNSAVVLRHRVKRHEFDELWSRIEASGSGEPGIYFTNDKDWGTNPCAEIALRPNQFCNLTEINGHTLETQEDLNNRAIAGAILGTLQAGYTDFHYLRPVWRETTERDALLGIGMTGIAAGDAQNFDLTEAAEKAVTANRTMAERIGINPAARVTTVKPSGTSSLVLGTSSGIHAWHDKYYIRRMRLGKNEAIYTYLNEHHPELVEDEFFRPDTMAVVEIPQKAPDNAITRDESVTDMLQRVSRWNREWVRPGHIDGQNSHNVSATVTIKPDEWEMVGDWMWRNRNDFNGLSVLPYDGGTYKQAPFETITEEQYTLMESSLKAIDLTQVVENDDDTEHSAEAACAGGACEVT